MLVEQQTEESTGGKLERVRTERSVQDRDVIVNRFRNGNNRSLQLPSLHLLEDFLASHDRPIPTDNIELVDLASFHRIDNAHEIKAAPASPQQGTADFL